MFKRFFWILVIGGAVYGGYSYYSQKDPATFSKTEKDIFGFLSKTAENVGETVRQKADEKKEEFLKSAEESAKDYVKEKAAEAVFGLGEKIQSFAGDISPEVTPSQSGQTGNPPAAIVIKKGESFSVSIQGASYSVDWGDGNKENEVTLNGQKLINHSWLTAGDYFVRIEVKDNGETYTNVFSVRVTL